MSSLLALVAVFLVVAGFNYLKVDLNLKTNYSNNNLLFEDDNDWDNDGLSNREESLWNTDPNNPDTDNDGYLDGEEVTSGHDPLIPTPNDLLPTDDNITMKMSQLALAGLVEGSLKLDSPNYEQSLNDLADVIANDAVTSFEIDISKIELQVANSDTYSQQNYIEEFSQIYEKLLKTFVEQMLALEDNLNNIGAYGMAYGGVAKSFDGSASRYQEVYNELLKMNVPKNWESNHLGVVKLTGELSQASQSVVSGANDPIKAVVGLNKIVQLWEVLPDITEAYAEKIKTLDLKTGETIFN